MYLADTIDLIREVLDSGGEFRLYPRGISMLPMIRQQKDSVVLKKRLDSPDTPLRLHEIAFYLRENGQFVLHRVMKVEQDGSYTMCGDNQLYLEKGIQPEQIIGYVSLIYKKEKPLELTSLRYRLYLFFWKHLTIRRIVWFPRRVLCFIKRKSSGNK